MAQDMGRGIMAPNSTDNISTTGVQEMRAIAATAAAAIGELGSDISGELDLKANTSTVDAMRPHLFSRGLAPYDADWNDYIETNDSGLWFLHRNRTSSMSNLPPGHGAQGQMLVLGNMAGVASQIYVPYGYSSETIMVRYVANASATNFEWGEWAPLGGSTGPDVPSLDAAWVRHRMLQTQFLHAMGGPIDTGGKAAVAIRCDHGLANFHDKVLPVTRSAGITVSQAYNPRNWHYPENEGVTPTMLNSWVEAGDVEIWNHSASHMGAESAERLYAEIVEGKAEVEAELPAARGNVWGFVIPGVSTGDYMGLGTGAHPGQWDGLAGRLILAHHAVANSHLAGTELRVLDGTVQSALDRYSIDSRTPAQVKAKIDEAINAGRGLQLMLHPSRLDASGYLSSAGFEEIIDYLVQKRDAEELMTLSPYQLTVADATVKDTAPRLVSPGIYEIGA